LLYIPLRLDGGIFKCSRGSTWLVTVDMEKDINEMGRLVEWDELPGNYWRAGCARLKDLDWAVDVFLTMLQRMPG